MSVLFKIENKRAIPVTETLLLYPFKDIWERDTSKHKALAIGELSYIEFMSSFSNTNPFIGYPVRKRHEQIVKAVKLSDNWKPDELIEDGIKFIDSIQEDGSVSYSYCKAALVAAKKMENFFLEVDVTQVNPKTYNPIYKPTDITRALKDTEEVITKLEVVKKKVQRELFETNRKKSDKVISQFAKI